MLLKKVSRQACPKRVCQCAHLECVSAMLAVDRKNYVHADSVDDAYQDSPQPIGAVLLKYSFLTTHRVAGYRATISAPHMHAMCLEELLPNLKPVTLPLRD